MNEAIKLAAYTFLGISILASSAIILIFLMGMFYWIKSDKSQTQGHKTPLLLS
jgi:preprotein translocase subunit YajC